MIVSNEKILAVLAEAGEPIGPNVITLRLGGRLSGLQAPSPDMGIVNDALHDMLVDGLVVRYENRNSSHWSPA